MAKDNAAYRAVLDAEKQDAQLDILRQCAADLDLVNEPPRPGAEIIPFPGSPETDPPDLSA